MKTAENKNYIMGGVGYIALLAAVIEQAKYDAAKGDADAMMPQKEMQML